MNGQIAIYKRIAFTNNRDSNMRERERDLYTLDFGDDLIMNNCFS